MKFRILLLVGLLWMLSSAWAYGQMQPPITTGQSWSTAQFQIEDSLQRCASQWYYPPSTGDSLALFISRSLQKMLDNCLRYNAYNDSLFIPTFSDDWGEMIYRRSRFQSDCYSENRNIVFSIYALFRSGQELPDEAYDSLFYSSTLMHRFWTDDQFALKEMVDVLIPHFEADGDVDRLLMCYPMAGFSEFKISQIDQDSLMMKKSLDYYLKEIELSKDRSGFESKLTPFFILSSYCNVMVGFAMSNLVPLSKAYEMRRQLDAFYKRNREQFNQIPNLENFYVWICNLFDLKAPVISIQQGDKSSPLFKQLYKNYHRSIRSMGQKWFETFLKYNYSDMVIEQYYIRASLGEINANQAFLKTYDRITSNLASETMPDRKLPDYQYLFNAIVASIDIMELGTFTDEEKHDYVFSYLNLVTDLLSMHSKTTRLTVRSDIEYRLLTLPAVQRYLVSDELVAFLTKFISYEQPQTVVHVQMVSQLCEILLESVINLRPSLLVGLPGYNSCMDVWGKEKELKAYMIQAAKFHDLGKSLIPVIVNNNFRPLKNTEFQLLRKHPEMALKFLNIRPELQQYADLALGHHKWYNGKGGYPDWFDNTASPYRILIDILTICDCTDAATEIFGRNYHRNKYFNQVVEEFSRDVGTRYNPELIQLIQENPALMERMSEVIEKNRMNAYYDIYQLYFK